MATSKNDIQTDIDFIADLPLYKHEKPFFLHPSALATMDMDLDKIQTTNVEWDERSVTVHSMRDRTDQSLEKNGFCYVKHESKYLPQDVMDHKMVSKYREEGEEFLRSHFNAEFVQSYDFKIRKNIPMNLDTYDPYDPLTVEAAAIGAHDITLDTVPELVKQILKGEQQQHFLRPIYRLRLINIWRSVLPECQDRPLALCDYTSINASDLLATDRVYPTRIQEIYHLKYNKQQKWYWLPNQKSSEPFLFMTFDSHAGTKARYCPHISVSNPLATSNAPPRHSVESRNLVITTIKE